MKISGSVLAVKDNYIDYAMQLKYANIDYLHVDIFQQGTEFQMEDLLQFGKEHLAMDVHMIYEKISDEDIGILNTANIKFVNVQYENLIDKSIVKELGKKLHAKFGIAITKETPLSIIDEYIDYIDQVLIMCSQPGISGGRFDVSNYDRIREIKNSYPSLFLSVDGGVDSEIGEKVGKLGVSMMVSGSYLCKDMSQILKRTYSLKYLNEKNIRVTRNMMPLASLPVLTENESFSEIVNIMNQYRLGVVFVVENKRLKGIIGDGDIRRGFIKYQKTIFDLNARDLMNETPLTINSDEIMENVFEILGRARRGVEVIPITENGCLIGALDLHIGV